VISTEHSLSLNSFSEPVGQCGPTFCDSLASQYNAANMAGRKQNTKIMTTGKIKKVTLLI
jgi:hypothetical protein